jgi:hypothetical protein
MRRGRYEDVFGLDVAVEKVVTVNVLKAMHDLEQNALDAAIVKALVVASLHQLVKIAFHVFHANVELLAIGVQEDVEGRDEVWVLRDRSQEDDFSELEAWCQGLERLLHRFDGDLASKE